MSGTTGGTPGWVSKITQLKSEGYTIREIASAVGKSKTRVHHWLKKTQAGQMGSGVPGQDTKFEIHDYQVTINILEKPRMWQPNTILSARKVAFKVIERNGWEEYFFKFSRCSVHITPFKFIIFPPRIQSKVSITDAKAMADAMALELIPKLEQKLEVTLSKRPTIMIGITRQHAVMMNDKIFDALNKIGFKHVKDDKGDIRLILDRSGGEKHIEGIHKVHADGDINNFYEFTKEVLTGNYSLETIDKRMHENAATMSRIIEILKINAEQQKETTAGLFALTTFLNTVFNVPKKEDLAPQEPESRPDYIQ